MELKKLEPKTLAETLREMKVGETALAPDGYAITTVKKACCELTAEGLLFQTSMRTGTQTITRLK